MAAAKKEAEPDRIAQMFHGRTVFITGGTGFLGKVLIEKLLRSCSGVKCIYLLIRNKKGKTPQERINEIFNNVLFSVLKEQQPDALKKCCVIPGDVTEVDLGISPEDRRLLQDEVEFIYHSAATTRFDDSMRVAARMNTRGTKYTLDLAEQCKKLKAFIHVSTAYAYPKEKVLYERPYKPPANPHEVLNSINWIKEDESGKMTKELLGDCPNTYTFTKALAEALVVEKMDKIPAIIARPSVVVPILLEPVPGWCNNLQGPMGLFVGAGKGIIRSMYVNPDSHADFIPADLVINALLLIPWYYINFNSKQKVYNVTASSEYNYSWEWIIETGKEIVLKIMPFNGVVWYPGGSLKKTKWVHTICFYLFQLVPAVFIDALLIVLGYKPILYQIQRRIQKGSEMFEYYTTRAWNFSNECVINVRQHMNDTEREIYNIHGDNYDVKQYFVNCMHSVRVNNLKETDDMLPAAWRHMRVMWVLDRLCKAAFIFLALYYVYKWTFGPAFDI